MARPTFAYPFAGDWPVHSPYGPRGDHFHTGTDFGVPHGIPILAANDGTVIYVAYEAGGAGNTVTIEGSDGWQSRYHHLDSAVAQRGQAMRAGDLVGYCGTTGASSGPHLHFEIRENPSTPVDPIPILETDSGASSGVDLDDDEPEDDDMPFIAYDSETGSRCWEIVGSAAIIGYPPEPRGALGIPQSALDRGLKVVAYNRGEMDLILDVSRRAGGRG